MSAARLCHHAVMWAGAKFLHLSFPTRVECPSRGPPADRVLQLGQCATAFPNNLLGFEFCPAEVTASAEGTMATMCGPQSKTDISGNNDCNPQRGPHNVCLGSLTVTFSSRNFETEFLCSASGDAESPYVPLSKLLFSHRISCLK